MDLDYLLSRQRISLASADRATCAEARIAHAGLAKTYAGRIAALQTSVIDAATCGAR